MRRECVEGVTYCSSAVAWPNGEFPSALSELWVARVEHRSVSPVPLERHTSGEDRLYESGRRSDRGSCLHKPYVCHVGHDSCGRATRSNWVMFSRRTIAFTTEQPPPKTASRGTELEQRVSCPPSLPHTLLRPRPVAQCQNLPRRLLRCPKLAIRASSHQSFIARKDECASMVRSA
jgi:hypothetical protein